MSQTILVADDTPDIRRLIVFTLKRHGYTVLEAADGETALMLIRRERPALAVLDIMMPRMTGLDVASELAQSADTASIPVLICSGSGISDSEIETQMRSATSYLPKPFTPRQLVERVEEMLKT
jgi:DNA-binding response OmpR family regulator